MIEVNPMDRIELTLNIIAQGVEDRRLRKRLIDRVIDGWGTEVE